MSELNGEYNISRKDDNANDVIEISPPINTITSNGKFLREKRQDGYIKLWVGFRDSLLLSLKGCKLSVFLCIALHMDDKYLCYPSVDTIASETGFERRQVFRSIGELEKMGMLTIQREQGKSNIYRVEIAAAYCNDVVTEMSLVTLESPVTFPTSTSDSRVTTPVTLESLKEEENLRTLLTGAKKTEEQTEDTQNSVSSLGEKETDSFSIDRTANKAGAGELAPRAPNPDNFIDGVPPEEWFSQRSNGGSNKDSRPPITAESYKERVQGAVDEFTNRVYSDPNYLDFSSWPEEVRSIVRNVCRMWGIEPPGSGRGIKIPVNGHWVSSARELKEACGEFRASDILNAVLSDYKEHMVTHDDQPQYDVSTPGGILTHKARAKAGQFRQARPWEKEGLTQEQWRYIPPPDSYFDEKRYYANQRQTRV